MPDLLGIQTGIRSIPIVGQNEIISGPLVFMKFNSHFPESAIMLSDVVISFSITDFVSELNVFVILFAMMAFRDKH